MPNRGNLFFLYIFTSENQHIQKNEIQIVTVNKPKIDDLAYLICREGWPLACRQEAKAALSQAFDYVDAVIKKDVSRVDRVNRNSTTTRLLLRSYTRNQGSQATIGTIVADMSSNDENEISIKLLYRPIYRHCHFRPWSKRPTERPQHDGAVFRSTLRARPSCICRCH